MAKLSLTARKNIKEYETQLQENVKKIAAATGITFELEVDWLAVDPVCAERGYENRAGEVVYSWYMGGLADNIVKFCKDPIQRESFVEAFSAKHTIAFIPGEKKEGKSSYSYTNNADGVLQLIIPKENLPSNTSQAGEDLSTTCSEEGSLSVATRKDIADHDKNRVANLAKIAKATGVEAELDVDWGVFAEVAKERGYADRIGEIIYEWYLAPLAKNLTTLCADDMSKEAVVDAWDKKTITFALVGKDEMDNNSYVCTKFKDGVMTICVTKDNFVCNVDNTGKDIESRL